MKRVNSKRRRSNRRRSLKFGNKKRVRVHELDDTMTSVFKDVREISKKRGKILVSENIKCRSNEDIPKCSGYNFKIVKPIRIIGAGTYGLVIRGIENTKSRKKAKLIVKVILDTSKRSASKEYAMKKELEYSAYMSEMKLGPTLYNSFHYEYSSIRDMLSQGNEILNDIFTEIYRNRDKLRRNPSIESFVKHIEDKSINPPIHVQFIAMEGFDMDCADALYSDKISLEFKEEIASQMSNIIQSKISAGMFCNDLKPGNFVVNIRKDAYPYVTVRMIDFGEDFCASTLRESERARRPRIMMIVDDSYIDKIGFNLQQRYFLFASILIFISFPTELIRNSSIMNALFNNDIFETFFNYHDWKYYIYYFIVETAKVSDEFDILTQLSWYGSNGNRKDLEPVPLAKDVANKINGILSNVNKTVFPGLVKEKGLVDKVIGKKFW